MADIFISYSKLDRLLVEQLAADLQSMGWSVWWDRNLTAGFTYRDEIVRELVSAGVVVVLWSESSIRSDWVRAEAGRAKNDGKLVPLKTSTVSYSDIPLPFGEMHTEPLDNREIIHAAISGHLAQKPKAQYTILRFVAALRYQALTWLGIVGGSITLFCNVRGALQLADWVKFVTDHWQAWVVTFWQLLFSIVGIYIPKEYAMIITYELCVAFLFLGAKRGYRRPQLAFDDPRDEPSLTIRKPRLIAYLMLITAAVFARVIELVRRPLMAAISNIDRDEALSADSDFIMTAASFGLAYVSISVVMIIGCAPLLYFCRDLPAVLGFIALVNVWIFLLPFPDSPSTLALLLFLLTWAAIVPIGVTLLPAARLNQRLLFLLMGVLVIATINVLSQLGLGRWMAGYRHAPHLGLLA